MMSDELSCGVKILAWQYEEIEKLVVKLYKEQNIRSVPIDPFEIVKNRGYITVPFSRFKNKRPECADENSDAFSFFEPESKTYYIAYNDDKPLRRIRFTLMHEVGHIDLGHKSESALARKMADTYAGYALAPVSAY